MNCLTIEFRFGSIETPSYLGKMHLVIKSNRGQLSIFMGITLILVMGLLGFIINVGLFVKAKINLQNATDAAAFAGAATQARQLTNIAYMNWELHNTYKEWMFKYYVLGQLGQLPSNLSDTNLGGTGTVKFTIPSPPISGITDFDKYNIPSICIHNNTSHNICQLYAVPGIPRFPSLGVPGIADIHEAFVNTLAEQKGLDCVNRSKLNYLTALTWAYGSGLEDMPEAPLIATRRPGAWVQALEIAMRIRNLEMIVNRPPIVSGIDVAMLGQLESQSPSIGLNERPVKAFTSAYRNLGGGAYKDAKNGGEELSSHFKLYELAPTAFNAQANSVSASLIKGTFAYPDGTPATQKHYLDLQIMPVNLATMFSTFVVESNYNAAVGVNSESTCGVSKTALPVPGYIMGFQKNPQVLTYYAVKAESQFVGLFFPIVDHPGYKLSAYAAAKPFGGRIGPRLFNFVDNQTLAARSDDNRSAPFVSGLHLEAAATTGFKPGMPIPPSQNFWTNSVSSTLLGGVPGTNAHIYFGIPNLIYDFDSSSDLSAQQSGSQHPVQIIDPLISASGTTQEKVGLYLRPQMKALKQSILGFGTAGSTMTGDDVMKAIVRSRRPTRYDAINYLIPDFRTLDGANSNNAPPAVVRNTATPGGAGHFYPLFAPLFGPGLMWSNGTDALDSISTYIHSNSSAVDAYLKALLDVANGIYNMGATVATKSDTHSAAQSVHANAGNASGDFYPPPLTAGAAATDPACLSHGDMASKFYHFFSKAYTACGIKPLETIMVDYLNANATGNYFMGIYYDEPSSPLLRPAKDLMTAYYPGPRQGVENTDLAVANHPLKLSSGSDTSYSARRNYYSTKFFHMSKVIDTLTGDTYVRQPALHEENWPTAPAQIGDTKILNLLQDNDAQGIASKDYFHDF